MYNEFDDRNVTDPAEQSPRRSDPPYYAAPEPPQYTGTPTYSQTSQEPAMPAKKSKTGLKLTGIIALCLCVSLIGGILGGIAFSAIQDKKDDIAEAYTPTEPENEVTIQEGDRENTVIDSVTVDTGKLMNAAQVYAAYVNSTVGITTSITTNFWGYQSTSAASGSGFILSQDGYVLTNYHVIEDSDAITVSMYDGSVYDAELIGYDESNDIAVLKIEAEGLAPVVLGDSDNMNVGDSVVAIGNPLGELTFSLTAGTVSALNRDVTMSNGLTMTLIQTDCAINSGNSGGALFNMYGEVIGITNAKYSSSSSSEASIDNIGFAIPMNDVKGIVESIIEKGYISKPYIGVSVSDVSAESQSYGLPQGAAVRGITEGSPAEESGLKVNDIITHVNGTAVTGSSDVVEMVGACQVGDELKLNVYRQGQNLELTIVVGEQIQSAMEEKEDTPTQGSSQFPFWGY